MKIFFKAGKMLTTGNSAGRKLRQCCCAPTGDYVILFGGFASMNDCVTDGDGYRVGTIKRPDRYYLRPDQSTFTYVADNDNGVSIPSFGACASTFYCSPYDLQRPSQMYVSGGTITVWTPNASRKAFFTDNFTVGEVRTAYTIQEYRAKDGYNSCTRDNLGVSTVSLKRLR